LRERPSKALTFSPYDFLRSLAKIASDMLDLPSVKLLSNQIF
jgi:hypothetical protein